MTKKSANDVIDRLKTALQLDSDSELCRYLDLNRAALGNWRSRDSVPYTLCVNIAEEHKIDLNWLLTGEGTMLKGGANDENGSPKRLEMLRLLERLDDNALDDAIYSTKKLVETCEERRENQKMRQLIQKLTVNQGQHMAA